MSKKKALVTGASGQDSLLLSEYLLKNGYEVWATSRRVARPQSMHVQNLIDNYPNYHVIPGDITDFSSILTAVETVNPHEFYNLAAMSHVGHSFKEPLTTFDITAKGVLNCLEAIRKTNLNIRFYQASSSEMFGGTKINSDANKFINTELLERFNYSVINENTSFAPRSPYACAKVFGHTITANYREAYGIHASCGILFNHESIYRKLEFVTRKVTAAVTEIFLGIRDRLKLGTLDFARDWGWAGDYVRAMHLMLQQDVPDDYIVATGKVFTARQLLDTAFGKYGMMWEDYVELDEEYSRPSDVKVLIGDYSKIKNKLGFEHSKSFEQMINEMLDYDYNMYCEYGRIIE